MNIPVEDMSLCVRAYVCVCVCVKNRISIERVSKKECPFMDMPLNIEPKFTEG